LFYFLSPSLSVSVSLSFLGYIISCSLLRISVIIYFGTLLTLLFMILMGLRTCKICLLSFILCFFPRKKKVWLTKHAVARIQSMWTACMHCLYPWTQIPFLPHRPVSSSYILRVELNPQCLTILHLACLLPYALPLILTLPRRQCTPLSSFIMIFRWHTWESCLVQTFHPWSRAKWEEEQTFLVPHTLDCFPFKFNEKSFQILSIFLNFWPHEFLAFLKNLNKNVNKQQAES
jgi:hypothetical protein